MPLTTVTCSWCSSRVGIGVRVCRGCNADVVYAATRRERVAAFKWGLLLGFIPAAAVIGPIASGRGPREFPMVLGVLFGIMFACALGLMALRTWMLRGKVRFFRRTNL
jgi:hypothetical protein